VSCYDVEVLRQAMWLGVGVALGLARGPGCGSDDDAPGGVNAPCTRGKDCASELVCVQGVCVHPDAGRDVTPPNDAGPVDAGDGG
jgi:hypothetical protein